MSATTELLQEGRYRIEEPIFETRNGSVYQAYDTVRNSNVVVKEIVVRLGKVTTLSQQESLKLAFTNQARALTEIHHDSILHVHDFFSEVGRQYLVLENIDGDDFQTLLKQNKRPFPFKDVAAWADQLLDGMHYLHNFSPPIFHKNIKPRYIRLTLNGGVKLFAHGLSDGSDTMLTTNINDDSRDPSDLNYSPLELIWEGLDAASQKVIVNSYDDRSERALKEPPDARSDIYSLGATLYYLLTAKVPVDPLERSIELLEGNKDPLVSPNKIDSRIPKEISDVILRAMEIKRENRFDSAVIMRQVLRTAIVRIQEIESTEMLETEEAAEDLRLAEKLREERAKKPFENTPSEIEKEQSSQAEIFAQKLREAEEQRIAAELRAADAERQLREQAELAAAKTTSNALNIGKPASVDFEDDLLGLITSDAPNVKGYADSALEKAATKYTTESAAKNESEIQAFHADASLPTSSEETIHEIPASMTISTSELAATEVSSESTRVEAAEEDSLDTVEEFVNEDQASIVVANEAETDLHLFDSPNTVEHQPQEEIEVVEHSPTPIPELSPTPVSIEYSSDKIDSDEPARPSSSFPIPMIAGAVVLIVFAVIGGWLFLGSTSSQQTSTSSNSTQSTLPPTESNPEQSATQNAAVPESGVISDSTQASETAGTTLPAETKSGAKPQTPSKTVKAAEPAKTPAPKKSVTVDDLINDN